MTKKRAFITGITGQDGYYLTKYLLENDYKVYGLIRRHSSYENEFGNVEEFKNKIQFIYGDLTDRTSLEIAIGISKPHEVYNLAAQSHVRVSFDSPVSTMEMNAMGTLNLLETIRLQNPTIRFYQASTSEMFGNQIDEDGYQRETTPMIPVSPYGISKLVGHNLCHLYRKSYGMYCASGILFNHESPLRGGNFVTQKIVRGAVSIYNRRQDKLELGNLDARRDWGFAGDYVKAMHLMLQQETPEDFVIATGQTILVREFLYQVFLRLGLHVPDHVVINNDHKRPEDVMELKGSASKAHEKLGWTPKYNISDIIRIMIEAELERQSKENPSYV